MAAFGPQINVTEDENSNNSENKKFMLENIINLKSDIDKTRTA